ncbi:hypothetical protein [Piscinibacter sp. XHJ-5]|uniref:hypothetical protein n=1 Tax=Piscinibacter sp. XHJ-5 TaxID=3037797 RepID=UPI00245355DF|nr:hypothetical protein [Piscinibacter sp. XHJ-5]
MKHTVIALFDQAADAHAAAEALKDRGLSPSAVHVAQGAQPPDTEPIPAAAEIEGGPASGLLHRLALLFGVAEEPHVAHYVEAVRRGGTVVQVDAADEAQATAARDALLALGAVNIDDRVEEWQQAGWTGSEGPSASADGERGVVHRQEVSIGGVRVYGHAAARAFDEFADEFRSDCDARYAQLGGTYDDFEPAYRYGHALAADPRYEASVWGDIEAGARADWERRYPQRAWERYKTAVQHAWERVTRP